MNEKIAHQIEKMKKQTIGVEVEMNNIKRDKAARLAADFFGTGRYENTASRNGYMTWSAWDEQGREWKFQKDVSIAGDDAHKCEMVTPILKYEDMETLQELIRKLRKAGTKSDATRGCGVHIHIGAKGHTPQTMRNLANIMASHESLIAEALDLDRGRMRRYCRTVDPRFLEQVNKKKPKTMSKLADIWYGSQDCSYGRNQHYNASGADRAYRRAVDKLTELLVAEGAIHAVRLKQKSKTKRKKKIAAAIYEYQADCDGEWGEIVFDFESGTGSIVRLADWDTIKTNWFANEAIRYILSLSPDVLTKYMLVLLSRHLYLESLQQL